MLWEIIAMFFTGSILTLVVFAAIVIIGFLVACATEHNYRP